MISRPSLLAAVLALAACARPSPTAPAPVSPGSPATTKHVTLESLREGDVVSGFRTKAAYVDDDGRVRGARFIHERTGFTFDDLAIESVPQAFLYAITYPSGDGGEPHTQEHLLLGKGNKGRWLGSVQHATFGQSGAFTTEHLTAYHFNTSAGPDTFWRLLRAQLDVVLHPDYSDEEIRREVRNFGVTKHPDKTLAIVEQGNVYDEMVRQYETPETLTWFGTQHLLYGVGHPKSDAYVGAPEGLRALTPEDIHAFHASHYHLANMGLVAALPTSMSLETALSRMDEMLRDFAAPPKPRPLTDDSLPPPHGAPPGTVRVVDFPYASADHPARALLTWPPTRKLDPDERTVMELFLDAFADGRGSNLYAALVDRKTRALDIGATGVWDWTSPDPGQAIYIGVNNVASAHADDASMLALRATILGELAKIAALPDGSKELAAFGEHVKTRAILYRRTIDKRLDTPPQFGEQDTRAEWIDELDDLARVRGFRKALSHQASIDRALALASSSKNEWRDRIRAWGLLETPYVVVARASPEMRTRLDREREARGAAEVERLKALYGTHDAQEALRKREAEIAHESELLAKAEASVQPEPLASDPPMSPDESLRWTTDAVDGVPRFVATFDTMKSATVSLALKLDTVPEDSLPWVGVFPSLVRDVGVLHDGKPIPYDELADRLRREVLGVNVYYSTSRTTKRAELAFDASGNDPNETAVALGWAHDFLFTPDWRVENLPRIRDVLREKFTSLHDTRSQFEDKWIEDVEDAYRRQDEPLFGHTQSLLTRVHDAFLVSWRLEGGEDAKGVAAFLRTLRVAGKKLDRSALTKLTEALASTDTSAKPEPKIAPWVAGGRALSKEAQSRVRKAGHDLGAMLGDVPDGSLASDWAAFCDEMADGVSRSPADELAKLRATLGAIRHKGNARLEMVSSTKTRAAIAGEIEKSVASLDPSTLAPVALSHRRFMIDRAAARGSIGDAAFPALIDPSLGNASLVHRARAVNLDETREGELVDYLAANVFNGGGPQSLYKRVWQAGLAYGGSYSADPSRGIATVYADRCGDISKFIRFAEDEVRAAPADPRLVDYVVVPALWSWSSYTYETRASAMAMLLVDGRSPEKDHAFRERVLALRKRPGLADEMHARYVPAMGKVIPSLLGSAPLPEGAVYFTVGPEGQIAAYEREIERTRGAGVKVLRLWPRDFWDVASAAKRP